MRSLVLGAMLMLGCMSSATASIATNTHLIDQRFSDLYREGSHECLAISDTWGDYDFCMREWEAAADAVRILIASALAMDIAEGRDQHQAAGCRWYRALQIVDATCPYELPSVEAGLESKWRRKCGKP
jgi:hypothetical protein